MEQWLVPDMKKLQINYSPFKLSIMDKNTKIKEIMTTNVITLRPYDTMDKVKEVFDQNNIHHIPIIGSNKIVGIISQSDYLKILHGFTLFKTQNSETYNNAILRSLLVAEVMTRQVATLSPEDSIQIAADHLRENHFHALPIVSENKELFGIVTTYDLINYAYSRVTVL